MKTSIYPPPHTVKSILFFVALFLISAMVHAQNPSDYYFRTLQSGNWNDTATWEMSTDNVNWDTATFFPDFVCKTITIQTGHTVTLTVSDTVDQLVVNGTLIYGNYSGSTLTINEGTGVDLTINGTFDDSGPNNINWIFGSSWQFGSTGTLIRTRATSSINWHFRYYNGTGNMPATANWILRKTGSENPMINGGYYFPNLTIENNTGTNWSTGSNSSLTGTLYYRIKGNLDIGGSGSGTVTFTNDNTFVKPVLVSGNISVQSGSTLQNNGTGFDIKGDLTVNGTLNYGTSNNRFLIFSGSNEQSITGAGTLNIYRLTINKNDNLLSLGRSITIDNKLYLIDHNINIGAYDLVVNKMAMMQPKIPITPNTLSAKFAVPAKGLEETFIIDTAVLSAIDPDISDEIMPSYVQTTGTGKVIKKLAANENYILFPIGDALFFTPYLFEISPSAVYDSTAQIAIRVVNSAEPNTGIDSNYINRYWQVELTDISSLNTLAAYLYYDNDITGNKDALVPARWTTADSLKTAGKIIVINDGMIFNIAMDSNCVVQTGNYTAAGICNLTAEITASDNDNILCNGQTDTLTANSASSYLWNTSETAQSIVANSSGNYIVAITDEKGCTALDTITVNASTIGNNVIAENETSVCQGDSIILEASGGTSYNWSSGDTTATTKVSPDTLTMYYVTVSDELGCTAYDSIGVAVNSLPTAHAWPDTALCFGVTGTLYASGGIHYRWNTGDTTATLTGAPPITGILTFVVTVTNSYGCEDADSVTVTVNALPDINAGEDVSLCAGMSDTLTATGGSTYIWNTNDSTASIIISPDSTTLYIVSTTLPASGCTASDSVTVSVNEYAIAEAGNNIEICNGKSDTLTASGGNEYLWSNSATTASIIVAPDSTSMYWVTVGNTGCTDIDSVTVTVNSVPAADAGSHKEICTGDTTTLTATGGGSYHWSTSDTTATITVNPAVTTVYTVTITNTNGCTDTDTATVTAHPLPVADAGFNQSITLGDTAILTASGGTHYVWNANDTTASIIVAPTTATIYNVTVTDANGCSNTDDVTVLVGDSLLPYPEAYWHKNDSVITTIAGVGKVGIGTNNPTEKLTVAGNVKIDGLAGAGFMFDSTSNKSYKILFADENGNIVPAPAEKMCEPNGGSPWLIGGNKLETYDSRNYIGTCDEYPFRMFTNGFERMRITGEGKVGIGTTYVPQDYLVAIDGKTITSDEIIIKSRINWPDYVFSKEYKLPELREVEKYINDKKHLPGIPSAYDIEKDGLPVGEMNKLLIQKIEELTLYLIIQDKKISVQQQKINELENRIEQHK